MPQTKGTSIKPELGCVDKTCFIQTILKPDMPVTAKQNKNPTRIFATKFILLVWLLTFFVFTSMTILLPTLR